MWKRMTFMEKNQVLASVFCLLAAFSLLAGIPLQWYIINSIFGVILMALVICPMIILPVLVLIPLYVDFKLKDGDSKPDGKKECNDQGELIPNVKADIYGFVLCPYCEGIHQHGSRGNGIASGRRRADCVKGEYVVIPEIGAKP